MGAYLYEPGGDRLSDLVRRVFLEEVDSPDGHLRLRRPGPAKTHQGIAAEGCTWLTLHKELGHLARRQPVRVGADDRRDVGGLAVDGDLARPGERGPPPLARLRERPAVGRHLLPGERA